MYCLNCCNIKAYQKLFSCTIRWPFLAHVTSSEKQYWCNRINLNFTFMVKQGKFEFVYHLILIVQIWCMLWPRSFSWHHLSHWIFQRMIIISIIIGDVYDQSMKLSSDFIDIAILRAFCYHSLLHQVGTWMFWWGCSLWWQNPNFVLSDFANIIGQFSEKYLVCHLREHCWIKHVYQYLIFEFIYFISKCFLLNHHIDRAYLLWDWPINGVLCEFR